MKRNKMIPGLICGLFGCLCFGAGDCLMIYGEPAYSGEIWWLTEGVRKDIFEYVIPILVKPATPKRREIR